MEIKKINIIKASIFLSLVMFVAKFVSFIRDIFLAYNFGTSPSADAFLASNTVLMLFVTLIISPFAATFLPVLTDIYYHKKNEIDYFLGSVYTLFLILGILVMGIQFLFLEEIINLVFPGLNSETSEILYTILIIQLPLIPLTFLLAVNRGVLQLINKFSFVEITTLLSALLVILYFIITLGESKIEILSMYVLIGGMMSFLIQYYILNKNGIKPRWNLYFFKPEIKIVFLNMIPFMLASGARQINDIVDKSVASLLPSGSISIISYAQKISVTEIGLISSSISIILFSQISKNNSENNKAAIKENVTKSLNYINTLIIPIAILTIVLKDDIISLLFGRGEFGSESIKITANTMMFYAIGMIGFGTQDIITRALHGTKHIKFPMIMSLILVFVNIILNLSLYKVMGVYGIALASSISVLLISLPLVLYFNIKVVSIISSRFIWDFIKILISAVFMGVIAWYVKLHLTTYIFSSIITIFITSIVALIIFSSISYLLKNEIIYMPIKNFIKNFKKGSDTN